MNARALEQDAMTDAGRWPPRLGRACRVRLVSVIVSAPVAAADRRRGFAGGGHDLLLGRIVGAELARDPPLAMTTMRCDDGQASPTSEVDVDDREPVPARSRDAA